MEVVEFVKGDVLFGLRTLVDSGIEHSLNLLE